MKRQIMGREVVVAITKANWTSARGNKFLGRIRWSPAQTGFGKNHRRIKYPSRLVVDFRRPRSTLSMSKRAIMHTTDISAWKHKHDFTADTSSAEKRTHKVIALTAAMMIVEIVAGTTLHSMALLADGWHMSTHVAAFVLTALAYYIGRRKRQKRALHLRHRQSRRAGRVHQRYYINRHRRAHGG